MTIELKQTIRRPEAVVGAILLLQIMTSIVLIAYFSMNACGEPQCAQQRLFFLHYFNEDRYVAIIQNAHALYMFYNVFVPLGYFYVATTVMTVGLFLFRWKHVLRKRMRMLFIVCFFVYLAFLSDVLLIPPSLQEAVRLQRRVV